VKARRQSPNDLPPLDRVASSGWLGAPPGSEVASDRLANFPLFRLSLNGAQAGC
jgi:hypothetical protein